MAGDEDATVAVPALEVGEHGAHAQRDVGPRLPARGAVVELPVPLTALGLLRVALADTGVGEGVGDPEVPVAQPLVEADGQVEAGDLEGGEGGVAGAAER